MNILLVCNAGMSTGIMKVKLEQEAKKRGLDATVNAIALVELADHAGAADAVLLGPQIRFAANDVRKATPDGVPVMAISPQDFGTMNAAKVLDEVVEQVGR
ncbi:PTS sugar transporter subunit IIB [Cellulomonas sp. Y8]|uniref:PTS sugar transporter subunit IIB n=1 Tax=Cellulomonas sp. Y8 TaxID=2591145 RepID=UPI003D752556